LLEVGGGKGIMRLDIDGFEGLAEVGRTSAVSGFGIWCVAVFVGEHVRRVRCFDKEEDDWCYRKIHCDF